MTERSLFWTDSVGDGGPYTQDQSRQLLQAMINSVAGNVGVLRRYRSELVVTSTGANNLRVAAGGAVVNGTLYENDANEDLTSTSPGVGTTGRMVVLRKTWATREVRAAIITSADGNAAIPAVTQTDGVTWEIPLQSFTITTGGAITLVDDLREFQEGVFEAAGHTIGTLYSTRYTIPGYFFDNFQTGANIASDVLHYIPIIVLRPMHITALVFNVTVNETGLARCGIYNAVLGAGGLEPDPLLIDAGSVAITSSGTKVLVVDIWLQPGYYFVCIIHNDGSSADFDQLTPASLETRMFSGIAASYGPPLTAAFSSGVDAGSDYPLNGLPDPAVAPTLSVNIIPVVMLREDLP